MASDNAPEGKRHKSYKYNSLPRYFLLLISSKDNNHARIQRGDRGSGPPSLKNHKNIGFLSNTGWDPILKYKATKPSFDDGPKLVVFGSTHQLKKTNEKKVVKVGPHLQKLSGSVHDNTIAFPIIMSTYIARGKRKHELLKY